MSSNEPEFARRAAPPGSSETGTIDQLRLHRPHLTINREARRSPAGDFAAAPGQAR